MTDQTDMRSRRSANVLVLLPVLNEAGTIENLLSGILGTGVVDRILVVDDGSDDGTLEQLNRLQSRLSQLDVVERSERGLGTALLYGFRRALDQYDFQRLVTMDADLSHDPARIPELLSVDADLVLGSRYSDGGSIREWPLIRKTISFSANSLARILLGLPAKDVTTGFRVYRRNLVDRIAHEAACGGYEFQVEAIWLAVSHGQRVAERPICFVERRSGRSKLATFDESLRFVRFVAEKSVHRLAKASMRVGHQQVR